MTNPPFLRLVARLAMMAGYAVERSRIAKARLRRTLRPTHDWRRIEIGDLAALVPPGWGEVEESGDGGFVIHNRPRSARVDGDAVWYASAVELRIRRGAVTPAKSEAAMTATPRRLASADGPVEIVLAIANGTSRRLRREAKRVLASVTVQPMRRPVTWHATRIEPGRTLPLAHERVAVLRTAGPEATNQRAIDLT